MNPEIRFHCRLLPLLVLAAVLPAALAATPDSVLRPAGKDSRTLNLDFEAGSLRDWTPTGNAFDKQPVRGDTISKRRNDMKSDHQGEYWIGGYERVGDDPQGTLTSVPFKVTQPWCSFLFAGGNWPNTRIELVRADTQKVFFKTTGVETESLRPVVVNLEDHLGKEIFIRLVDEQSGPWGHVNFDNFVFHAAKPNLSNTLDPAKVAADAPPPADVVKFAGLSPEDAAKEATVPPGFKLHLFAGEPNVVQPIAFTIDERGRLWVAEGLTYPRRRGNPPRSAPILGAEASPASNDSQNSPASSADNSLRPARPRADLSQPTSEQLKDIFGGADRVLVFEDTDGDHKFDKKTVFLEHLNLVSGIEIGFGGLWVGAAPYLMFIPIKEGDEPKPGGDPQILLDGWDYKADTHEVLNSFIWGPDGWLYGCHGVFCPSFVGKPATPAEDRQRVDAAVWRYHPTKHLFEVFAEGTSNPWGVDFDEYGQCLIEACVIPHLWHMIQGGRYERQGGQHYNIDLAETRAHEKYHTDPKQRHVNPFIYEDIKTIGDHVHYAGNRGPHAANGRSDTAGGGHAHAGLMMYLGESWPEPYRNKAFMNNIHGQRLNMDILERKGSGYIGHHGPDFVNFNDTWSQVLNMRYDQDGSVYIIDWYDKNQCHHNNPEGHDRSNGRIFKLVYKDQKVTPVDLGKQSDDELLALVPSKNEWMSRTARRLLQERFATIAPLIDTYYRTVLASSDSNVREKADPKLVQAWNRQVHWAEWVNGFLGKSGDQVANLRLLWLAHVSQLALGQQALANANKDEHFRAWRLQLTFERGIPEEARGHLAFLSSIGTQGQNLWQGMLKMLGEASRDESPVVRLYGASALQRLPVDLRWEALGNLLRDSRDVEDHNLPLMYWYALEPCVEADPARAVQLLQECKIPKIREFMARRLTTLSLVAAK